MKKISVVFLTVALALCASAQVRVTVHDSSPDQPVISAELFGHFSEHLGRCIYEGVWVGPDSSIPNHDGYRTDVLEALRELKIPVLRWPGGCFADEYHWMDGIGPRESRPKLVNNNWGRTVEDNSFGTHEFLNLCELIGAEPYISGNVGSGTVEELAKWVEYMTADEGTMAELRARNGRKEPWKVKYLGIGNENWGCGGDMTPQYYSDVYKRYALYARNYADNQLFKVACGANGNDYEWTRVLMKNAGWGMNGLSLHFYTVDWSNKGSATRFDEKEYYKTLGRTAEIEELLTNHCLIMDAFDPERRVALCLDEWGTWFDVEPGTNPGHLYQQNTMRDAMVAAFNLNLFPRFASRLRMANIAQLVNVLQSMILTDGPRMVLTPTYHVFNMFKVHQGARYIPSDAECGTIVSCEGKMVSDFNCCVSRDDAGVVHVSMANPRLDRDVAVELDFDGLKPGSVSGQILRADRVQAHNDFDHPTDVAPAPFKGSKASGRKIKLTLPAASVVVLEIR